MKTNMTTILSNKISGVTGDYNDKTLSLFHYQAKYHFHSEISYPKIINIEYLIQYFQNNQIIVL
jgi:hypothetical protein